VSPFTYMSCRSVAFVDGDAVTNQVKHVTVGLTVTLSCSSEVPDEANVSDSIFLSFEKFINWSAVKRKLICRH